MRILARFLALTLAFFIVAAPTATVSGTSGSSLDKIDALLAAQRYFDLSLQGDELEIFWSRLNRTESDSSSADIGYKFRASRLTCLCVADRKNYGPRFANETGLRLSTRAKALSSTPISTPPNGVTLANGIKATKLAEVQVEFDVVGESVGNGQYEWTFRIGPKVTETKTFTFAFVPRQKNPKEDTPFPGWYLLHNYKDPMYISPDAVLEYYQRQTIFLQNRAKYQAVDDAYRATIALTKKNLEQFTKYLSR